MKEPKEIIQEIHEQFGLNESQIAEKSGVPQPTVHRLANGKAKDCRFGNYKKLYELHKSLKTKTPNV